MDAWKLEPRRAEDKGFDCEFSARDLRGILKILTERRPGSEGPLDFSKMMGKLKEARRGPGRAATETDGSKS